MSTTLSTTHTKPSANQQCKFSAVTGNINVKLFLSKFEQLKELGIKHIDALVITETKLDVTFPTSYYLMEGFTEPFRSD